MKEHIIMSVSSIDSPKAQLSIKKVVNNHEDRNRNALYTSVTEKMSLFEEVHLFLPQLRNCVCRKIEITKSEVSQIYL